jgi:hypothetical protein
LKRTAVFLPILFLVAASALLGQSSSTPGNQSTPAANTVKTAKAAKKAEVHLKPFSKLALSGGVGVMGVNMQAATNVNRYMNVRATGNYFNYTVNDISTNGFNVDAKLNFATAGAALDFYPFPTHGLRFSPGVLFHNTNEANATFTVQGGTSFTLNDYDYYASSTNPVRGVGTFGVHNQNPAFTITTGWGNMISRKGGHLSFPFELGVALVGAPAINVVLNSGQVCDAQGLNCVDVATDKDVQANLQAQIAKYKSDLDPLKTFPIVSFGVAYNFRIR